MEPIITVKELCSANLKWCEDTLIKVYNNNVPTRLTAHVAVELFGERIVNRFYDYEIELKN